MSIESDLRKEGIEVIKPLDTLSINSFAKNIAEKICIAFPSHNFVFQDLFISISRIPMYIANMPEGIAEANYFYKNSSIYFKSGIDINELEKFAIHEFIHHIQEIKDKNGNLLRLGLYEFSEFKAYGLALNEAGVQLATAKILNNEEDIVKYYDISFPTSSPTYYPIICNLVKQMSYITGDSPLFDSVFYSTNSFKQSFIELCGEKALIKIQDNLDKILNIEEKIIKLNNELVSDNCEGMRAQKVATKIVKYKGQLKDIFFETQNLIFTSYFDNQYNELTTTSEIEIYRMKLYNYKNYIGITEGYSYFNNYYIDKMALLENKYESILNNVALVPVKNGLLHTFFKTLKKILGMEKTTDYYTS